jgi:hypothetical protein
MIGARSQSTALQHGYVMAPFFPLDQHEQNYGSSSTHKPQVKLDHQGESILGIGNSTDTRPARDRWEKLASIPSPAAPARAGSLSSAGPHRVPNNFFRTSNWYIVCISVPVECLLNHLHTGALTVPRSFHSPNVILFISINYLQRLRLPRI